MQKKGREEKTQKNRISPIVIKVKPYTCKYVDVCMYNVAINSSCRWKRCYRVYQRFGTSFTWLLWFDFRFEPISANANNEGHLY